MIRLILTGLLALGIAGCGALNGPMPEDDPSDYEGSMMPGNKIGVDRY